MKIFLPILGYSLYAIFCCRILLQGLAWYKAARQLGAHRAPVRRVSLGFSLWVCAGVATDIAFLRRLLNANRLLWLGSWTFHLSFLFVTLRHLIYVVNPVPECIADLQTIGVCSGYILPLSLIYIAVVRIAGKEKYVSRSNFLILGLVFLISITGLLMHFFRPDLVDVKGFILGILAFKPEAVPQSFLFIIHFLLVLLLVPYLPSHIFSSPVIIIEARRREKELKMVLHEK